MKSLNINRKFERMFPGIAAWEKAYERDLLSHGSIVAEHNRTISEQQMHSNIDATKWQLIGTFIFDFEKQEEIFIPANNQ